MTQCSFVDRGCLPEDREAFVRPATHEPDLESVSVTALNLGSGGKAIVRVGAK